MIIIIFIKMQKYTIFHNNIKKYHKSICCLCHWLYTRINQANHQLNLELRVVSLLAKPLGSLLYGNITLLESDHDIVGYQVSDLIS